MPTATKSAHSRTPARKKTSLDGEESLFKQAYTRIEAMIASLELRPSQVVSENMLSAHLGLGRTPVREALQQLGREGMVVIMPRRGIVVADIDIRKQLRLLEFRRFAEQCLITLANRRASDTERAALKDIADRMDGLRSDEVAFLALDAEFNQILMDAAHNEYVATTMKQIQGASRRFWFASRDRAANLVETARLHAALARAVGSGNEAKAVKCLNDLLDNVEAFTRATLDH
ncbi:GntR family transcriptional regulator [Variovorax guangxiensis]|uniref:GntR family transcriptional regulator n=1 Tax=Variovorax guangxiensis TaxID=1775474 RepID=UPI0028580F3A|nr:GntR family transcriptional regulator [Variovorax guangxiensis]MDR6861529.1 DNA-binding GntR family transcriptional regulator [Variovorax guangxiensis]